MKIPGHGITRRRVWEPLFWREREDGKEDGEESGETKVSVSSGIGSLPFLMQRGELSLSLDGVVPERLHLQEMRLLPRMVESARWKVNGKERFYFHEALRILQRKHYGCVKLPTGSGKTAIALTLASNQLREIGPGLVLVPSLNLKQQFLASGENWGLPLVELTDQLERWGAGDFRPRIVVSTPKLLTNRLEKKDSFPGELREGLEGFRWIITDEVHHSRSDTFRAAYRNLPNLVRTHGFSATPTSDSPAPASRRRGSLPDLRELPHDDALSLVAVGPVIYSRSSHELREFLTLPRLISFSFPWERRPITRDWGKLQELMDTEKRNRLLASLLLILVGHGKRAILFVPRRKQGMNIARICADPRVVCWYGGDTFFGEDGEPLPLDGLEFRERYTRGEFRAIISTSSYQKVEGLDLGELPLNALVLTSGKSNTVSIQKGGRVTRPDGEETSLVINLRDLGAGVLSTHGTSREQNLAREFGCSPEIFSDLFELSDELGK